MSLIKNRIAKARRLADVLQAAQCPASVAATLHDSAWREAAAILRKDPPSEETKSLTIAILEEREARGHEKRTYCPDH